MDVNLMQNAAQLRFSTPNVAGANSAYSAYAKSGQNVSSADVGDAYAVNISDAAKQAQQDAKVASATPAVEEEPAAEVKTKGLSTEEIQSLQDSIKVNEQTMLNIMIQALSDSNNTLQGWFDNGTGILNFGGTQIEAAKFALPEVATNPEDAAKAVGEGGAWSVDAVATRLFDLATAIAGNDPEKLQEMRGAIEEGFAQAGQTWNSMTGSSTMPDITSKTYNELMHRFDAHMQELTGAAGMMGA